MLFSKREMERFNFLWEPQHCLQILEWHIFHCEKHGQNSQQPILFIIVFNLEIIFDTDNFVLVQ